MFHDRNKHIIVDCYFVGDKLLSGEVTTPYVSKEQLADIFTKSLYRSQLESIIGCKMGLYDVYAPP